MAGWTDYHATWTTSADLVLASDSVLAACIEAGRERYLVNAPGATSAAWTAMFKPPMSRDAAWDTLLTEIESMITAPLNWANQTDNGGDWNNQPSIPSWTTASLATAAYAGAWPSLAALGSWNAELPWQMYKILNLIIWRNTGSRVAMGNEGRDKEDSSAVWATAVTDFNATAWDAWSTSDSDAYHYADKSGATFRIYRRATRNRFAGTMYGSSSYEMDIYAKFTIGGNTVYDNADYAADEDNLYIVHSDSTPRSGNFPAATAFIGNTSTATVSEPTPDSRGWSYVAGEHFGIARYNVAGGFDFV